jgi:hypothetical protein
LGVSGLTLRDNSGFKNNGTLTNGPTWAVNQGRYALSFDGSNDFANLGSPASLNLPGVITASAWIKLSSVAANAAAIIGQSDSEANVQWAFEVNRTAARIGFAHGGGSYLLAAGNTNLAVNTLYHVVAVRTGSAGAWTVAFYVNGVADGATTSATNPQVQTTVSIGRFGAYGGDNYFPGFLDDVRIYNRALSAQEIRTLATRRGIAYEMAPRRRSSVQVTTNRRRRIIIGGNR